MESREALAAMQRVSRDTMLCFLELQSSGFAETLRIVDDSQNHILNGVEYVGFPFGFTPPSDQSKSASQIKLVISNVGRAITEDLERLPPNTRVTAVVKLVDSKRPQEVVKQWRVPLSNVTVDMAQASATCGNFQFLKQQAVRLRFDQTYAPGAF